LKIESAFQDKDEIDARVQVSQHNDWPSNFKFLNAYNGWRKGFAHLFIGNTHAGKSTFVRSIILDACLRPDARISLFLSEESGSDFKTEMAFLGREIEQLKRVTIYSEQDNDEDLPLVEMVKEFCRVTEPDLFILDNITTSASYNNASPAQQSAICQKLKRYFSREGIPWVVFAHTAKGVDLSRRLVTVDNIRGNATIGNDAQFTAGLQKIEDRDGATTSVLRILKHRGQNVPDKVYTLEYNPRGRVYYKDFKCRMELVNEWLKRQ
jgi:KaiC/GvpD/RAD55 family RecA-like ATPase